MQLKQSTAPYISHEDSSRTFMINVILSLNVLYIMAFLLYGSRVLLLGLVGLLSSSVSDWIAQLLFGKKPSIHDLSAVVTGLLIPLMLPASIPFRIPAIAAVFAVVVAKQPFGGTGNNIFNPAAAGYAFAVACFSSDIIFKYPTGPVPVFDMSNVVLVNSPSFTMNIVGGFPNYSPVEMLLGSFPGPMGATNILVLLACLAFLISRRTVRWQIPVVFLATTCLIAFVFVRVPDISRLQSMLYENMSGLIVFGAVFMMGDPVTTPKRVVARTLYAVISGIVVMVFRYSGKVEETFAFALLIMNASVWRFDTASEIYAGRQRRLQYDNRTK